MTSGAERDMAAANPVGALRAYGREVAGVYASGQATEHSYRPALRTLVEALAGGGVGALNEP